MAEEPQSILTPLTDAAIFLTVCVDPGGEDEVLDLLPDLGGLRRSVGFRAPDAGLSCVVGVGATLWERLFDAPPPPELHPFRELRGPVHTAPSTPGDLFFHIRAGRLDLCFELARLITDRFDEGVRVVDEVHGFRSFDERDLLGFVDGTENPEGGDAEDAVVIAEDDDPAYAGGSYLLIQKYTHDLVGWNKLSIEEQEAAFGRTKLDDVEFADEDKAPDSHLTLNVIEGPDGQRQIMRFNMPFGRVGSAEFGTFYIAYAKTAGLIEEMLDNMFLGKGAATHDRILDFSTALTGSLYFVPGADFLDDPPAKGAAAEDAEPPTEDRPSAAPPSDGSLGIGGLK
jgi:putative iron-dependent peroxidase